MNLRTVVFAALFSAKCFNVFCQDGSIDPSFDPGLGTGSDGFISKVLAQSDGKIVIAGDFTSYNGTSRVNVARLHADGTLDNGFVAATEMDRPVNTAVIQSNGKIILGGDFNYYNGAEWQGLVRLNTGGSLDASYVAGKSLKGVVYALAVQGDGKVIVGGSYFFYFYPDVTNLTRLNNDGTPDNTFVTPWTGNISVTALAIQKDGKILAACCDKRITRVNTDGSIDAAFDPGSGADGYGINNIVVQDDGKILISGEFTVYNGTARSGIARLNADGSLDTSFDPGTGVEEGRVVSMAIQADGKILAAGRFKYNGVTINGVARLNENGSLDLSLDTGEGVKNDGISGAVVNSMALQNDGKILLAGHFSSYRETPQRSIVRLSNVKPGLTENQNDSHVRVYPVPAKDQLTLQCGTAIRAVKITDLLGKIVLSHQPSGPGANARWTGSDPRQIEIYLPPGLLPGIYFVEIETDGGTVTEKVMVGE